jgi:hypothetical protein
MAFVACTFLSDLNYLSDGVDAEISEDGGGGGDSSPRVISDVGVSTPGRDAETADACTETRTKPIKATIFEPMGIPGETPQGLACNPENAIEEDNVMANLDRTGNGDIGKVVLRGKEVAGCVAVDFAPEVSLETFVVRLGPVPDGCGVSPCDDAGCNTSTGWQAHVFAGPNVSELEYVGLVKFSFTPEGFRLHTAAALKAHVIVVCRHGNVSATRDDVGLDAVYAVAACQ